MRYRLALVLVIVIALVVVYAAPTSGLAYTAGMACAVLLFLARPRPHPGAGDSDREVQPTLSQVAVRVALVFTPLLLIGGFWALVEHSYVLGVALLVGFAVLHAARRHLPNGPR